MFNKNKKSKNKDEEFKLGFNKFKKDILKQKKVMFSFFVLNFLLYFLIAASPLLTGKILDALVTLEEVNVFGQSISSIWFWFGLYIFLGLVHRVIHPYIFYYKIPKMSNKMYVDFYQDKFSKIILLPTSFFKRMGMGKMIYSINTGAKSYSEVLLLSARFLSFPTMAIFYLSFLIFLS
jgi:ABC-type bacteriocin/lantibiotic exporter with double-glycine peptidase domain